MFQPPLYYVISAAALSLFDLSVTDAAGRHGPAPAHDAFGITSVRAGIPESAPALPQQLGRQLVGLVLAAFLPMNLYLSHYVTNETFAALLVSVSIYLCLRILKTGTNSWASFSALGFVIGAAVLTKFTAVLAIPFIVVALAGQTLAQRDRVGTGLKNSAPCWGWQFWFPAGITSAYGSKREVLSLGGGIQPRDLPGGRMMVIAWPPALVALAKA